MKRSKITLVGIITTLFVLFDLVVPAHAANIQPTLTANPNVAENYISLNWAINDHSQPYRYQLFQVREGEDEANSIQAKSSVTVLNIYPDYNNETQAVSSTGLSEGQVDLEGKPVPDSGILKTWLQKENIDNINIDAISLTDFNANPSKYLKKENGMWNYDSVFYGMWNLQPEFVYPNDRAIEHLRTFIHDGGGFMTSHHTMGYKGLDRGVNKLATEMGVEIFSNQPADWPHKEYVGQYPDGTLYPTVSFVIPDGSPRDQSSFWPTGTTVEIVKKGYLTEYPFEVGEIGQRYTIPNQHGLNIFGKGDVWVKTVNPKGYNNQTFQEITVSPATGEKGTNNFYVHTYNNTAIINSGHSFPKITQAETRIIANSLYYLSQITTNTSWDDRSGQDMTAPELPDIQSVRYNKFTGDLKFDFQPVQDKGTTYNYYVKATALNDGSEYTSEQVQATISSGLKGYSIVVDDKPDTLPDMSIDTMDNEYEIKTDFRGDFYIHIAAIDKQNNTSYVHYKVERPEISIVQTPEDWTNKNVSLKATAKGVDRIILPNGTIVTGDSATYVARENKEYSFIGLNSSGDVVEVSNHVVSNIDNVGKSLLIIPGDDKWRNKDIQVEIHAKE